MTISRYWSFSERVELFSTREINQFNVLFMLFRKERVLENRNHVQLRRLNI
jgi:hypothetical protein